MVVAGIVLAVVIGGFTLLQVTMIVRMKLKKGKTVPNLPGAHGRRIKKGDKVLLYFYSTNCRACKAITPVVKALQKKRKDIFSINITKDMDTARKLSVMGTPSFVVVEDGIIKEYLAGAIGEQKILELID
ncbi:MAG: thioredoxin [Spirochaetes bacterium]|nr:MAG: thioredoxin [Spirochaetota bacterium]